MSWVIRAVESADAPRLLLIQQDAFAELSGFRMRHWQLHDFNDVIKQCVGWVALDEMAIPQAYILLQELREAWEVLHLATHPAFWGREVMSDLIRFVIEQRPPQKAIWLEVHEKNQRAIDLYERLGFRRGGRRPRFYGDGGAAILFSYF
jgi:ribosomal-protein-alanine N-acetyltransferase